MTKTSKIFLTLSITALALSFTEAGSNFGWGILRPVGAIAFIAFFITNLLAKEMALYDQQEQGKQPRADQFNKASSKAVSSTRGVRSSARLKTAAATN